MTRARTHTIDAARTWPVPAHWSASDHVKINGRNVTPGRLVSVTRARGRFAFVRHVINERTGAEWLDVRQVGTGALRAFYVDEIRIVHRGSSR